MDKNLVLTFSSSLENIVSCNESFDAAVLYVAYTGVNRNGSSISKDVFEQCISSIYNVPVVANYDRESNTIGGHDIEIIEKNGTPTMVNVTQPVGVVPESASYWWETVTEDDGSTHEYLCTDVLLWKRQEAYSKIKEDGITAESMEIAIQKGHAEGGIYVVDEFQFQAFCLLGNCAPCFESASLTFSDNSFMNELTTMLTEVPRLGKFSMRGGNERLNEKLKLLESYGLKLDDLDFEIADFDIGQLTEKLKEIQRKLGLSVDEDDEDEEQQQTADGETEEQVETSSLNYSLSGEQLRDELCRLLCERQVPDRWGDMRPQYYLRDVDESEMMVYAEDVANHFVLVGMKYSFNGDAVVVDWASVQRYKVVYTPFDEGTVPDEAPPAPAEQYAEAVRQSVESKYTQQVSDLNKDLEELRSFKQNILDNQRRDSEKELFARFSDLEGNEAFEALKSNCSDMSMDAIEDKCYSIRGRTVNFSLRTDKSKKGPVLPVGGQHSNDEPYGGIVAKYL